MALFISFCCVNISPVKNFSGKYIASLTITQEEMRKQFHETTLPARLEKFAALLKGPFFMGDKVRHKIMSFNRTDNKVQPKGLGGDGFTIQTGLHLRGTTI